jgi:hypothetical protein
MADAAPLVVQAGQLEPDPRHPVVSNPDAVEIEIRAGFCDPDPKLFAEAGRRLFAARGPLLAIGAASLSV